MHGRRCATPSFATLDHGPEVNPDPVDSGKALCLPLNYLKEFIIEREPVPGRELLPEITFCMGDTFCMAEQCTHTFPLLTFFRNFFLPLKGHTPLPFLGSVSPSIL